MKQRAERKFQKLKYVYGIKKVGRTFQNGIVTYRIHWDTLAYPDHAPFHKDAKKLINRLNNDHSTHSTAVLLAEALCAILGATGLDQQRPKPVPVGSR